MLSEKPKECVLCSMPGDNDDEKHHIIHRGVTCYLLLNLYPYTNGHMLVAPYRHTSEYDDLTTEELAEMAQITKRAVQAVKKSMRPGGFNIGLNQGQVAGAGIHEHLHFHIVPRWNGDINFMPAVAGVKVMPQSLDEAYETIRSVF